MKTKELLDYLYQHIKNYDPTLAAKVSYKEKSGEYKYVEDNRKKLYYEYFSNKFIEILDTGLNMALEDIELTSSVAPMGAFMICNNLIDCLSNYYSSQKKPSFRYNEFVDNYLNQYMKDKLYKDLRSNLIHHYSGGTNYIFDINNPDLHLEPSIKHDNRLRLNLSNFIADIKLAKEKVIKEIENDTELFYHAVKVFKEHPILIDENIRGKLKGLSNKRSVPNNINVTAST